MRLAGTMRSGAVELDVSAVQTAAQLHELLSAELSFPDYYGRNWDAFDECIRDPEIHLPDVVRVRGMRALAAVLPREAALFRECASAAEAIPTFHWLS